MKWLSVLTRCVFSLDLKELYVSAVLQFSGSLFQICGASELNAASLAVVSTNLFYNFDHVKPTKTCSKRNYCVSASCHIPLSRLHSPSDCFSGHLMIDNRAADVSGSSLLMTIPEERPDWTSPAPLHPAGPFKSIHHWLKLEAGLECQRWGVDEKDADEMRWFECCVASQEGEGRSFMDSCNRYGFI